ncbi:MAG: hypothetical protein NUV97_01650 [archaeon]|nr:hypothetical protein [archaeon]MCR4323658.1 hypothetical protein [Nanoarchaeota archaeon]
MGLIEYHQGCKDIVGCFGPRSPYFTIFGTELRFLTPHLIISLIFGIIVMGILYNYKNNRKLALSKTKIILISLGIIIIFFFLLSLLFPAVVVY